MEKKKGVPRSRGTLIHGLEIALLAIHHFRSFCRIRRLNPLPALCTLPAPQFAGVSQCHAVFMPLIRAFLGERKSHSAIELQLLGNDFKRMPSNRACEDLLADILWYFDNSFRNRNRRSHIYIFLFLSLIPLPTSLQHFFFGKRRSFFRNGLRSRAQEYPGDRL